MALVTGAGSGIGQAAALLFAREGARVAVVDIDEAAAKATAQQIEQGGGEAIPLRCDVSKAADNQAAVERTLARWGRLNTPEDIARAALFLASDDAAMVTGTCVEVDGGRCI